MASVASSVGPNSGFIPVLADSGRLQIEFSRNKDSFPLNKYIKTQPVKRQRGRYLRIDQGNHSRLVGGNLNQFFWNDSDDRPVMNNNGDQFQLEDFQTNRRNFGDRVGEIAKESADWDLEAILMRTLAQKAMTARTKLVHDGLSAAATFPTANKLDVGLAAGLGAWSGALSTDPRIKKTLNRVVKQIMLATNSTVRRGDLQLVINPTTAQIMSETQEIIDVIKQSPSAMTMLTNGGSGWTEWLLPSQIYGVNIVVEDTVITTSPRGASTLAQSFVMGDGIAYVMARPGELESKNDGPNYSTVTLMVKTDLVVEKFNDPKHKRSEINVVDDTGFASTAPISGFALTNLYS